MSKLLHSKFKCKCGESSKIYFKKPNAYSGSLFKHKCGGCQSEFNIKVFKESGFHTYRFFVQNEIVTEKLKLAMEAEREQLLNADAQVKRSSTGTSTEENRNISTTS